ncbi:hypothetical protein SRB5_47190 [Streptomyces sp. RB5]|uniref:Uncharacterized protein n=1 Tax=Streptomyces smaragdinus TaxID=2585196 RepID=A0A7K0CMA9_9ACTN|nr:hypothetical protein [Streptomyces smaragdinus]MQY14551.1 hypothetical protein [Streptomyces smaragdinus]
MATLLERSRTSESTGQGFVTEDYDANPALCRKGVWQGAAQFFRETVTLSYEHDPEPLNVFWLLNGTDVLYPVPGYYGGGPVLGSQGVTYRWPVDGFRHRISFTSTPGTPTEYVRAQVLYQRLDDPDQVHPQTHYGPALSVPVSGRLVKWPADKLAEEERCLDRFTEIRRRYVRWHKPKPGESLPGLGQLRGDDAIRLAAMAEQLETLDLTANRELAEALERELSVALLRAEGTRGLE